MHNSNRVRLNDYCYFQIQLVTKKFKCMITSYFIESNFERFPLKCDLFQNIIKRDNWKIKFPRGIVLRQPKKIKMKDFIFPENINQIIISIIKKIKN